MIDIAGPWNHRDVSAGGTRFHIAEMGECPRVLLLHGFPEFWWTWHRQLVTLADAVYHAVAMDLRGYGGSDEAVIGFLNSRPVHLAEMPAANMIGNARSLAKLYAATIGEVDGVRLLEARTVEKARIPQTDGLGQPPPLDRLPVAMPLRFGLGYELDRSNVPWVGPGSFGHTGAGGKYACADPETGVSVAYVCNNRAWVYGDGPDARWRPWMRAIRDVLRSA